MSVAGEEGREGPGGGGGHDVSEFSVSKRKARGAKCLNDSHSKFWV